MNEVKSAEGLLLFYGHQPPADGTITASCLSQWCECCFMEDGILYHIAEQYMMAGKARLFGDDSAFTRIMNARTPREYKRLGRSVKRYSESVWQAKRFEIVVNGNLLKFGQNEDMKRFLLGTGSKMLAEASRYDLIWGIGMSPGDPNAADARNWRGQNLLGKALMTVRELLREER